MFIIKFNKMIRNKWIWGIFALIVAFAFAFSDLPTSGSNNGGNNAGSLNGKPISIEEHRIVRQSVSLENERQRVEQPERETWKRIATLETAKAAGIQIPDAIVGSVINNDGSFRGPDGKFNSQYYRGALGFRNMAPREYEEIVRRQIAGAMIEQIIASSAFLAPAAIENRVKGFTDAFIIRIATLTNSHSTASVTLTDDEVRRHFELTQENYREPERRQVVYASFKAVDFLSEVSISEDEIADYYDSYADKYTTVDTNGVAITRPLEEVSKEIEDILAKEASKEAALRKAGDFSDVFYKNQSDALTFEEAAASFGVTIITSRLFSAESSPVAYTASPAFAEAAFSLEAEGSERFSDAIDGGDESYVMGYHASVASHIPDFDKVKARVNARALESKVEELFLSDIENMSKTIAASKTAGSDFAAIAAAQELALSTNFSFSHMDVLYGGSDLPGAQDIALTVARMDAGEFTADPIVTPKAALFVEVIERNSGDPMIVQQVKRQIVYGTQQELAQTLWEDWREKNLISMSPKTSYSIENEDAADYTAED